MRILIVGNDPKEIGGVANYTRPLATSLEELGNTVYYLYSGSWNKRYDLFFKPYLKIDGKSFSFECAEVVNSPNLPVNYGNPEIDIESPKIEKLVSDYLDKIKPDVMHVHSRLGFPFSINKIAYEKGIKVFNTIHVYGYICQKRVMINHNGDVCLGPSDMMKCGRCTVNERCATPNKLRILNMAPRVFDMLVANKRIIKNIKTRKDPACNTGGDNILDASIEALARRLDKRLRKGVESLNLFVHKTVCVSDDVRNTLIAFGVKESKLLVQHIGSTIAEMQIKNIPKELHDPVVVGNIGGVSHYKGSHILIEAIKKLKTRNKYIVKIFGKYDENYVSDLMRGNSELPIEFTGKYIPDELPEILKQIDIMVLPSICNDTAPQTIFESFSGRVPIVASNIGGFPDFITDGENGCFFAPGDSTDLSEKLSMLIDNPEKIKYYQANVPKMKTIKQDANDLVTLYSLYL